MKRLTLGFLLIAATASAEWSPSVKSAYLAQLDALRANSDSINSAINWGKANQQHLTLVATFSTAANEAGLAHLDVLLNLADLYGRLTAPPIQRPIFSCQPTSPCNGSLELPLPPRADVIALAQTMQGIANAKYTTASNALAAIEGACSPCPTQITQARTWLTQAREAMEDLDWLLAWTDDPRPIDGVLSAPGVTRDTAPAYGSEGSWFNFGRGIGHGYDALSTSWKRMVEGVPLEPASMNNSAFASRHSGALKTAVSALGLLVAVDTVQVDPFLDWMEAAAPGIPRQYHRWKLAQEMLTNIDPGGTLGIGTGGAPRGFDWSGRSYIETPTPEYNERMVQYGMLDYLTLRFSTSSISTWSNQTAVALQLTPTQTAYLVGAADAQFVPLFSLMGKWIPALRSNADAHFWFGTAAYRAVSQKHYPPTLDGPAPPSPCSFCGAATECIADMCVGAGSVLAPLTLNGATLALCEVP